MLLSSKWRPRLLAVGVAALVLVASACSGTDAERATAGGAEVSCVDLDEYGEVPQVPDEVTYLTGFGDTAREGYVAVADQLGIFERLGIEVTVQAGGGLGNNLGELVGGAAQFSVVDAAGLFTLHVNGEVDSVQALAAVHQQYPMSFMAFADSGIERPRDLNGRRIGLVPGSIADVFWDTYAELTPGLDPQTVEIVPTSNQTQTQELVAGQLDAIPLFTMAAPATERAGAGADRGEVNVLEWSRTFPDLYGYLLVAPEQLIADDPSLAQRFTLGTLCGLEYTLGNPREAAEILVELNPQLDVDTAVEELTLMREISYGGLGPDQPLGYIDLVRVARGMDLLVDAGEITEDFSHALPTPDGPPGEGVIHFGFVPGADLPGSSDGAGEQEGQP